MAKVFVGDLDASVGDEELLRRFSEFGQVLDCKVNVEQSKDGRQTVSKGTGFVVFAELIAAELACSVGKQSGQRVWMVRPCCTTVGFNTPGV